MKLLELFLDKIQTEKLNSHEIAIKSNHSFQKVYRNVLDKCLAKQKREEYTAVKPDIECEEKAQISGYNLILKRLDSWMSRCEDDKCVQAVMYEKNKIQAHVNYLQQRRLMRKKKRK